jgi:hypothetical protein
MINMKKRLSIVIDDQVEDEEEMLNTQIKKECEKLIYQGSPLSVDCSLKNDLERIKVLEYNQQFLNQILCYMENQNPCSDLSFGWYLKYFIL